MVLLNSSVKDEKHPSQRVFLLSHEWDRWNILVSTTFRIIREKVCVCATRLVFSYRYMCTVRLRDDMLVRKNEMRGHLPFKPFERHAFRIIKWWREEGSRSRSSNREKPCFYLPLNPSEGWGESPSFIWVLQSRFVRLYTYTYSQCYTITTSCVYGSISSIVTNEHAERESYLVRIRLSSVVWA